MTATRSYVCHREDCPIFCRSFLAYRFPVDGTLVQIGPDTPVYCEGGHKSHLCTCDGSAYLEGLIRSDCAEDLERTERALAAAQARAERAEKKLANIERVESKWREQNWERDPDWTNEIRMRTPPLGQTETDWVPKADANAALRAERAARERYEAALREIAEACAWDGEGQEPLCPAELIAKNALAAPGETK